MIWRYRNTKYTLYTTLGRRQFSFRFYTYIAEHKFGVCQIGLLSNKQFASDHKILYRFDWETVHVFRLQINNWGNRTYFRCSHSDDRKFKLSRPRHDVRNVNAVVSYNRQSSISLIDNNKITSLYKKIPSTLADVTSVCIRLTKFHIDFTSTLFMHLSVVT